MSRPPPSLIRSISNVVQLLPPVWLVPCLAPTLDAMHQRSEFSTTANLAARHKVYRKRRDGNPNRGVSALRRTGLRYPVGMSQEALPKPVLDPKRRSQVQVDPNHGLWGFFNNEKKPLTPPKEEKAHGRSWTVEELRHKSWEDLHSLWYVCCKEHNRMATERQERVRMGLCTGDGEAKKRAFAIRRTQQGIKHTLTERWYAWEAAWKAAAGDPEINLKAQPGTSPYTPRVYEEPESGEEEEQAVPRAAAVAG